MADVVVALLRGSFHHTDVENLQLAVNLQHSEVAVVC
jgi:hypothetical protein